MRMQQWLSPVVATLLLAAVVPWIAQAQQSSQDPLPLAAPTGVTAAQGVSPGGRGPLLAPSAQGLPATLSVQTTHEGLAQDRLASNLVQPHPDRGIRYVSGGSGENDRAALEGIFDEYNLHLRFAARSTRPLRCRRTCGEAWLSPQDGISGPIDVASVTTRSVVARA